MNLSALTLAFYNALGWDRAKLEEMLEWAKSQAPELGAPAELFRAKVAELLPDSPEKVLLFAADAWREYWGENPGYSSSGGLGAG